MALVSGSGGGGFAKKTTKSAASPAQGGSTQTSSRKSMKGGYAGYNDSGSSTGFSKGPTGAGGRAGSATLWNMPSSYKSSVSDYSFGSTPLMNTQAQDYTGGAYQDFINGTAVDDITGVDLHEVTGAPYLLDAEDTGITLGGDYGLGQWVQSMTDSLEYGQEERLQAAREAQVARGMGRSGEAILSEDQVIRETNLSIQQAQAEAAVQQSSLEQDSMKAYADLKTQRDLSNQRATEAWQALQEQAAEYQANLDMQTQLANQQSQLDQASMGLEYSAAMSELETQRAIANQTTTRLYEEMKSNYNLSLKELDIDSQIQAAQIKLGYYTADQDYSYSMSSLNAQYPDASAASGTDWYDITDTAYSARAADGQTASSTYAYLAAAYPGVDWNSAEGQRVLAAIGYSPRRSGSGSF